MNKQTRGFTIVELLIVIVVIGILVAITLVVYNNIQNKAATATLQSDTKNAYKLLAAYQATNNSSLFPDAVNCNNTLSNQICIKTANSNTISYIPGNVPNPTSYCLSIVNTSGTISYKITNTNSVPTSGTCVQSIAAAAGTSPLAVLTGASGSTGISDGSLSSGVSIYVLQNSTSTTSYSFQMGSGTNLINLSINNLYPFSTRNGTNAVSIGALPSTYLQVGLNPSVGPTVFAMVQSSTNRYVRVPGNVQVSNADGYSVTSAQTFTNTGFTRIWIFAGAHSQSTSENVMAAIAADSTVGAANAPIALGISPTAIDIYNTFLPQTITTGIAYGTPTPSIQWQRSSSNGAGTYVDIPGATSNTYIITQSFYNTYNGGPLLYFRAKLTNTNGTTYTSPTYIDDSSYYG